MPSRQIANLAAAFSNDAREAARLSRESKFKGLLFDAWSPTLSIPSLSATGLREFRHVLSSQDQTIVGLQASVGPKGVSEKADIDRLVAKLDELLKAATTLAAGVVCLDLGALPAPPASAAPPKPRATPEQAGLILLPESFIDDKPAPPPEPGGDPASLARVDVALAAFGDVADRYRVPLALSASLSSFASLHRAILAAGCPWFGIDLDTVSLAHDRWSIHETLSRLGSLVRHVRVRDAHFGADGRTRPAVAGRGDVGFQDVLSAIDASDYSGWFTIDPMELSDRKSAIDAARSVLARD